LISCPEKKGQENRFQPRYTIERQIEEEALMKRWLSALMLAALLCAFALSANAAGDYALVADTNRLNIRSGPGSSYPIIGGVNRGQWVEVISISGNWVQGRSLQDGASGYMSEGFLKIASSGGPVIGSTAVVSNPNPSSFLNLRQSPSYTAPVMGIFYNGATCVIMGETDGWYYVEISGTFGYFRGEFLRLSGSPGLLGTARIYNSNGSSVNLRNGPSFTSTVIGQGAVGTTVNVYLKGSRFWFVSMAGTYGFMDATFLTGGGAAPTPNPPIVIPETTNAIVTNTGRSLNLREQPSSSGRVLGTYGGGTALRVMMQGLNWSRVTVPVAGKTGYMMTRYLTLYGLPAVPTRIVNHPDRAFVNLRSSPSASASVTLRVPHGGRVTILIAGGAWAQVKYNSTTGYMMTSFLR
jgi:uncharacterized protein YgiM (DUF1202 family)